MYVKDFFFVNVLFFNFSLFIPRPSTGLSDLFMRFASNFALFPLCSLQLKQSTFSPTIKM